MWRIYKKKQRKPLWNGATHLYHAAYTKGSEQAPAFFLSTMMRQAAISLEKQRKQFVWRTKMIWKRLDRFVLGFSFVQGLSHRDDAMALWFYCELAREEKHEAWHHRRQVLAWTKGYSRFLLNTNTEFCKWLLLCTA